MNRRGISATAIAAACLVLSGDGISAGAPRATGAKIQLYPHSEVAPQHDLLGVIYVHRRSSPRFSALKWEAIYDSVATQARALGSDLVVHAVSGEDDPRDDKGLAKWVLGLAARLRDASLDTLPSCDNCLVDWLPLDSSAAGASSTEEAAALDRTAFAISRLRLGEQGYYLMDRPLIDSRLPVDGMAVPGSECAQATLSLRVSVERHSIEGSDAKPSQKLTFTAHMKWKISGMVFWQQTNTWTTPGDDFKYGTGADALATRTAFIGLYSRLSNRGRTPDSDHDGVPDSIDEEPNTVRGAEVDRIGKALDDDGDGVPNGIDKHYTRRGVVVDDYGVPSDLDEDGVVNENDECSNTPAGYVVDTHGCPLEVVVVEDSLLDVGMYRAHIPFETGRATLLPESFQRLNVIGEALSGLPDLRFSVDGHCDDRGSDDFNQRLSESRASTVIDYLVGTFRGVQRKQFTARGFGKTRPLVAATDDSSRAMNRRVEFTVANPEAARRQIERKRILRKREAVVDTLGVGKSIAP